ncbi:MAG: GAF domain-containing protein [Hyphomicrobiaceae bacterium]
MLARLAPLKNLRAGLGAGSGLVTAVAERMQGRLYRKYAGLLVALVASALIVSSGVESWYSYLENRSAIVDVQREKARGAAAVIEQFVREIEGQLGWTTHATHLAGEGGLEQRRFDFLRLLRQAPAITEVAYVDSDGREQLRVSRLAMDVVGSKIDRSEATAYQAARTHRRYVSPVYFRKESEPYLTLAITGASRRSGVTIAEVNLKFIWDVISRIKAGRAGIAYAVDGRGLLIAHPDIGLVLRKTDLSKLAQVAAALARVDHSAGVPAADDRDDSSRAIATDRTGRDVLTAYATVEPLDWHVFVEQPLAEAFEQVRASLWRTAGLALVGIALAAIAGLWLAQRMVVPIEALAAGASRIGAGDLGHRIDVKSGDEVEALAARFNEMGARLKDSYAGLEKKVEERTKELQESLEYQTATSEVLGIISESPGKLDPVFDSILAHARSLCSAEHGHLFVRHGDEWTPAALQNVPEGFARFLRDNPIRPDERTSLSVVAKTLKPFHIDDVRDRDVYRERHVLAVATVELGHARTFLTVPIVREGACIGALTIYRTEVRPFTNRQIRLVETFADQAVIAIENARLFEAEQTRTRELQESLEYQTATSEVLGVISRSPNETEPVFDTILSSACELCAAEFGHLILRDGAGWRAAALRNVPPAYADWWRTVPVEAPPDSLLEHITRTGRPGQRDDVRAGDAYRMGRPLALATADLGGARTLMGVPLLKSGEVLGAIVLYRKQVAPFSDKQIALLANFADQAVIAIENTRLFEEVQTRTQELTRSVTELQALGKVGRAVSSSLELNTVLGTILANACEISGTGGGAIYVLDQAKGLLSLEAGHNMSEALIAAVRAHPLGLDDPMVGRSAAEGIPVEIADIREHPSHPLFEVLDAGGIRALLSVPLIHQGRTIGVLVMRRVHAGAFEPQTVSLLESFASQSSIAINNARLFREIEEKGEQLRVASQHKSQFLANMSHELRTPLNAILGYTELIQDGVYGDLAPKVTGVLERVQANGRHLLGLINDVLDLSKIEAGQLTLSYDDFALGTIIHAVVAATESLAAEKNLVLSADVAPALPIGRGDERRITQVLLNLVGNAIKFTDAGEVRISAEAREARFIIKVRDTGPGISASEQSLIFEEFHQVDNSNTKKKGGTGLGLAISKRIIEMHGGRISVRSEPGKGATFRVDLPIPADRQRGKS